MKQKFHTFTAAPLFTSAEPIKVPKYKAGDTIYLNCLGDKYILTVSSHDEDENSVKCSSFKFKMRGDKVWTQDGSGFFYLDNCKFGEPRTIHPSLESLEGLPPVETGDIVYLSVAESKFLVIADEVRKGVILGSYFAPNGKGKWISYRRGAFNLSDYTRHALPF